MRLTLLVALVAFLATPARPQTPDGNLALKITSPSATNYRLNWFGMSGKKFQVQSSPNLTTWSNTGPVITGAGGTITVDDGPVTALQKFYRIGILGAVRPLPPTGMLDRSDDGFSPTTIPIGFTINFFGVNYSALWVNNNGNVTFDDHLFEYETKPLLDIGHIIIAPYWADVDTGPPASGQTTYSAGALANGHRCFAVTWPNVGYYDYHADKLNFFQIVLIERADVAPGDFDIEFNFDKLQWDTGGASSTSARVGLSNGSDKAIELAGSGITGELLDIAAVTGLIYRSRNSTIPGRFVFSSRGGVVLGAIQIDAGPDQILLPGVRSTVLNGSASDPSGPLTYQWTKLNGPGTAAFSNSVVLNPTVTFSSTGTYTLQLRAASSIEPLRSAVNEILIVVQ